MRVLMSTALFLLLSLAVAAAGTSWSQFRGPNGSGVYEGPALPDRLTPGTGDGWSVAVPFGRSSPIVHGDRIYLTASDGDRLLTLAFDRRGKGLWTHEIRRQRVDERARQDNDPASPTPAADASGIYVFFPDFGLLALDHRGRERWRRPLGPFHVSYGMASSPILVDGLVVQAADQQSHSFMLAVDAATGRDRWRVERPDAREGWYTPAVLRAAGGRTVLIVPGSERVEGLDASTGRTLWTLPASKVENLGVPLVDGQRVYVNVRGVSSAWPTWSAVLAQHDANGDGRVTREELQGRPTWVRGFSYADINRDDFISESEWLRTTEVGYRDFGLTAIDADPADATRVSMAWRVEKNLPYVPAPVLYRGVIYMIKTGGILTAVDAASGSVRREMRVPEALGDYFSSPVAGAGKLFVANQAGTLTIFDVERDLQVLSRTAFDDEIFATPVLHDGAVIVRTRTTLHLFRAPRR